MKKIAVLVFFLSAIMSFGQKLYQSDKNPIKVVTKNIAVTVDVTNCRWSAKVKGTAMQMNDLFFLPGDDPSGWNVTSSVKKDDSNKLGSFVTVKLHGTKPGQLDFDYQISVSQNYNDIIVSLGRTNTTGKSVDLQDMDYFVSNDARLGSTIDRWISLGTQSQNRELYDLWPVINLITPRMYIMNHVIREIGRAHV